MAVPIALSHLADELDLGPRGLICLVGGGGKTTLLHALGRQLNGRVVLTTTTKMGSDQNGGFPIVTAAGIHHEKIDGTVMVWKRVEGHKAFGVATADCDRWAHEVDYVVVEADGARQRPFKAPAALEPVVPDTTTAMISVIGADALGRVIADQCHRPLRVAALAGCEPYQRLSPAHAATVLLHRRGARKTCPPSARFVVAITKVDQSNRPLVDQLIAELHAIEHAVQVIPILDEPPPSQTQ